MFGFKKRMVNRVLKKQTSRAVTIHNCILAGIVDYLLLTRENEMHGIEPSDEDLAMMGGTAHWILGIDIEDQLGMCQNKQLAFKHIQEQASELCQEDELLEKLCIRLLFDICSLSMLLQNDTWFQIFAGNHIHMMRMLKSAKPKWPELFMDIDETIFKNLYIHFTDKYIPDIKNSATNLF